MRTTYLDPIHGVRSACLVALAIGLLSLGANGCGGSAKAGSVRTGSATPSRYRGDEEGEIEEGIRSVGYHDADDVRITRIGHAAGRADVREIASVVYGYQAAAAAGDARRACALLTKPLFRVVGPYYDHTPGHRTRASKTCVGGMAFLLEAYHAKITSRSTVTSVRIKGREAYALAGSPTGRAGYFMLEREHGRWRISVLLILGLS